jgi:hypothetical protein
MDDLAYVSCKESRRRVRTLLSRAIGLLPKGVVIPYNDEYELDELRGASAANRLGRPLSATEAMIEERWREHVPLTPERTRIDLPIGKNGVMHLEFVGRMSTEEVDFVCKLAALLDVPGSK